jgi:hypothetical protein
MSNNARKDKWSNNELMKMCVQDEWRLVMELWENAMLVTWGKDKMQANKKGKGKIPLQLTLKRNPYVFSIFYIKKGHMCCYLFLGPAKKEPSRGQTQREEGSWSAPKRGQAVAGPKRRGVLADPKRD